jgi:hypothetical protein
MAISCVNTHTQKITASCCSGKSVHQKMSKLAKPEQRLTCKGAVQACATDCAMACDEMVGEQPVAFNRL